MEVNDSRSVDSGFERYPQQSASDIQNLKTIFGHDTSQLRDVFSLRFTLKCCSLKRVLFNRDFYSLNLLDLAHFKLFFKLYRNSD